MVLGLGQIFKKKTTEELTEEVKEEREKLTKEVEEEKRQKKERQLVQAAKEEREAVKAELKELKRERVAERPTAKAAERIRTGAKTLGYAGMYTLEKGTGLAREAYKREMAKPAKERLGGAAGFSQAMFGPMEKAAPPMYKMEEEPMPAYFAKPKKDKKKAVQDPFSAFEAPPGFGIPIGAPAPRVRKKRRKKKAKKVTVKKTIKGGKMKGKTIVLKF